MSMPLQLTGKNGLVTGSRICLGAALVVHGHVLAVHGGWLAG